MKRLLPATLAFALTLGGVASAQIDPDDAATGTKLGVQQLNNSGQIGSVTLYRRGSKTLVRVAVEGAPAGRVQAVAIHRGRDCETMAPSPAYVLGPLKNGRGSALVNAHEDTLLSGNYSVMIYGGTQASARSVACGHLYQ